MTFHLWDVKLSIGDNSKMECPCFPRTLCFSSLNLAESACGMKEWTYEDRSDICKSCWN